MLGRIRTGTHVRRVHSHRFTRLNAAELVMTPVSRESDRGPKERRPELTSTGTTKSPMNTPSSVTGLTRREVLEAAVMTVVAAGLSATAVTSAQSKYALPR